MSEKKTWPLQYAKAHFSQLVNLAEKGEDVGITRNGSEVAVLISKQRYDLLTKKNSLFDSFLNAPHPDIELDISLSKELSRDNEL